MSASPTAEQIQALVDQGAVQQAIAAARQVLPQLDGDERARVLLALAGACLSAGQFIEALRAGVAASDIFKAGDDRAGVCDALVKVASALRSAGDHASAITTLEQAEGRARELGDALRIAQVLRNVGVACSIVGRHQQALSCLNEATTRYAQVGSRADRMTTRLSLYNARGRHANTLPAGSAERRAAQLDLLGLWAPLADDCAAAGLTRLEVMARGNEGIALHECGRHAEAAALLASLIERYRACGMRPNEGLCYSELGRCQLALADAAAARGHYLAAIEILRERGTLDDLQEALEGRCHAEEALGDHPAALAALKEVRRIDRRKSDEAARAAVIQRELRIELARLTSQWVQLATTDPLTGLANRRALERWMSERLPRVEQGEPLTLLLMDLDHFKQVNDRHGHGIGDEVLRRVAEVIRHNCRSRDLAVRYGGEEFVLALTSVGPAAAVEIAHRVRLSVERQPWGEVAAGLRVAVSIGVADATEAPDAATLLTLADRRLYTAKYAGRNQVVIAG